MFRFMTDFQGSLVEKKLRWVAGFGILHNSVSIVDIEALNKGKKKDLLPDTLSLYDYYINWGIIEDGEKAEDGLIILRLGLCMIPAILNRTL